MLGSVPVGGHCRRINSACNAAAFFYVKLPSSRFRKHSTSGDRHFSEGLHVFLRILRLLENIPELADRIDSSAALHLPAQADCYRLKHVIIGYSLLQAVVFVVLCAPLRLLFREGQCPGIRCGRCNQEWKMTNEPWVSVDDLAKHLGVAKDSIYRWIDHKGLPAHKIGRLWKFKLSEVDDWVREGGASGEHSGHR